MVKSKSKKSGRPLLDKREMEKLSAFVKEAVGDREFNSMEEANEFINEKIRGICLDDLELKPKTPLDEAQAIMYDAFGARSRKRRVTLAKEALKVCPDCADAYVLLAEETSKTCSEQIDLYKQGVDAGKRALGSEMFEQYADRFWSDQTTRPFMRALMGYGQSLWNAGRDDEAIETYKELLRLNKNDNQGVRLVLLPALIESGRLGEAKKFSRELGDEPSATIKYSKALLLYLTDGDTALSRQALDEALRFNKSVIPALISSAKIRKSHIDEEIDSFSPGSIEEAILYAAEWSLSWFDADSEAVKPAIVWALEFIDSTIRQESLYETFPSLEPASNVVLFKGKSK